MILPSRYNIDMRKTCKRNVRPLAKPLTPKQKAEMLLGPRLHLQLLIIGQYDLAYVSSVAGIYNIGGILAAQRNRPELQPPIEAAQEVVLKLIDDRRAPNQAESVVLLDGFNLADAWIASQNTAAIGNAVRYSDYDLAKTNSKKEAMAQRVNATGDASETAEVASLTASVKPA